MQLHHSTWQEIDAYLETSQGILIPVGSTEQHGPTGLIGTDALCPEVIAKGVGERTGALVAPTFNVGVAQHHMAFAGTISLRPTTMIAAIKDWVSSLACHGFERFYFLNGHGGNISTIMASFAEIHSDRSMGPATNCRAVRCALRNWWMAPTVTKIRKELYPQNEGSHATPSEISLTQFAFPDTIKTAEVAPKVAPNGGFTDAEDFRRRYPDGRMGADVTLASPEGGRRLYEAAIEDVIQDYEKFLAE